MLVSRSHSSMNCSEFLHHGEVSNYMCRASGRIEVFAATWEMRDFPCRRFGVNGQIPNKIGNPLKIHIIRSGLTGSMNRRCSAL